ncbi:ScbR family autoregulator-binding transcription factor [Streptomyces sp. H51]|uniref:ScbR family autoregulator-binding transcription factor n=1 Tax=Streptomyces sp. H51 TaxID=3111770 RepID=UPI002D78D7E3|nr:ScbR family autoregulator-binding transcription factor [Streptomyces sp. H51]
MKQERAERTRARLVRAASTVFDDVGYERAALSAISERAQVTKGALTFHFAAKSDLARAVQAEACRVSGAVLADLADRQGPGFEIAVDMADALVRMLQGDIVVRAGARLAHELETPDDPSLHCQLNWLGTLFRALRRARADGSLLSGVEVRPATGLLMSLVVGATSMSRSPAEIAFGDGPFASRRSTQEWLVRMLEVVRPALSER